LYPAKVTNCKAIKSSGYATKLGEQRMTSFDRAADTTDPGNLGLTAARSAHPKSRHLRSQDGRIIAKRPVPAGGRQTGRFGILDGENRTGRFDDH
jgi:hypothetical protein